MALSKVKAISICICITTLLITVTQNALAEKSDFAKAADLIREDQYVAAFTIFESLAEKNDHDAQFNTAVLLRKGIGHPANYPKALKWAWLAELGGNLRAIELREELIVLIPEDQIELVRQQVKDLLERRMVDGESLVILQMANFYLNVVAEPDYKQAYALRSLAAALNIKNAASLRDDIEPELDPEELIEAQAIAGEMFSITEWITAVPTD